MPRVELPREKSGELNIEALEKVFMHMSKSYKPFWFATLIEICCTKRSDQAENENILVTYNEMANGMIWKAWMMEDGMGLKFEDADALRQIIGYLQQAGLEYNHDRDTILEKIDSDMFCLNKKRQLMLYVPYRFQSPFLEGITWKKNINEQISELNEQEGLIYRYGNEIGLKRSIAIQKSWAEYFFLNYELLTAWAGMEASEYIHALSIKKRRKECEAVIMKEQKEVKTNQLLCMRCGRKKGVNAKSRYCRKACICASCRQEEDLIEKQIKSFEDIRPEMELRSLEKWSIIQPYLKEGGESRINI